MACAKIYGCGHIAIQYGLKTYLPSTFTSTILTRDMRLDTIFAMPQCTACLHIRPNNEYLPTDTDYRATLVSAIDTEYEACTEAVQNYNLWAAHSSLSLIQLQEFEALLTTVYYWICRADFFARTRAPKFFHDISLAFAQCVLGQCMAMRISVSLAMDQMPSPEIVAVVPEVYTSTAGNAKLELLAPGLAKAAMNLTLTNNKQVAYSPFEAVWRMQIARGKTLWRPINW